MQLNKEFVMQRSILALLASLATASAANALSIALVHDQTSYLPGDTVTISVVVDTTGGINDEGIFGRIQYDPLILLGGSSSQNPITSFGGALEWVLDTLLECGGGTCEAFGQVGGVSPIPVDPLVGFVISTMTFTAGAVGTTNVDWEVGGSFGLDFLGLTSAPGTTVNVVPEPTTGALLALGLAALGARRSRP